MGGKVLLEMLDNNEVWSKGPGDLVTTADFRSQKVIREFLLHRFPDHQFLGEEHETELLNVPTNSSSPFCWIVDPLDGTTNFVHRIPAFAVSIALRYRNPATLDEQVIAGCIYDPNTDECYSAAWGQPATLNQRNIHPTSCQHLNQALVVFSMGSQLSRTSPQCVRMLNVMEKAHTVRRLGSAALNLCYVASGRLDAYWATNVNTWDVAAGMLIARQAGAVIDSFEDAPLLLDHPRFCCSCTQELFDELKPLLNV